MSANCKWIEATTALASIIMALVSAFTLYVNVVERNEVVAVQKEAERQTEQLSNMVAKVSLQRDVLAAAGGDRFAYKRARDLMFADKSCDDIPSLLKSMNFAMQRFGRTRMRIRLSRRKCSPRCRVHWMSVSVFQARTVRCACCRFTVSSLCA